MTRSHNFILGIVVALLPILGFFAFLAVSRNSNRVDDWLPRGMAESTELTWFRDQTAENGFVIVSWDGCELGSADPEGEWEADDPRIEKLAQIIETQCKSTFPSVVTARRILDRLTQPPLALDPAEALRRLEGGLVGPDLKQTCLIVELAPGAIDRLAKVIGDPFIGENRKASQEVSLWDAIRMAGLPQEKVRLGGPPIHNLAIDREGERTLGRLTTCSMLIGLGLAWLSLRSVRLSLIVFACGMLSALAAVAGVGFCGQSTDAVLLSMPALIFVLGISGSLHIVGYYRESVARLGWEAGPSDAIRHSWKAALLCSCTTALGLLSLCTSELTPIRKYAIFSSLGVMLLLFILFGFLPAALYCFGKQALTGEDRSKRGDRPRKKPVSYWSRLQTQLFGTSADEEPAIFLGLVRFITRHHVAFSACGFVLVVALSWGLIWTQTSVDLMRLFDPRARIIRDYRWLESRLGNLVPLEIAIRVGRESLSESHQAPAGGPVWTFLDRLDTIRAVQDSIQRGFGDSAKEILGPPMSVLNFAPMREELQARSYLQRTAINQRLLSCREELMGSGYLHVDPKDGSELWRISLRVASFEGVEYASLVRQLQECVNPILAARWEANRVLARLERGPAVANPESARSDGQVAADGSPANPHGGASRRSRRPAIVRLAVCDPRISKELLSSETDPHARFLRELFRILQAQRVKIESIKTSHGGEIHRPWEDLLAFHGVLVVGDDLDGQVEKMCRMGINAVDIPMTRARLQVRDLGATADPRFECHGPPVAAIYTGVVPLISKAQRELLASLIESTVWSFVTITPLLMLVSRSISAGSVAMIPNFLPILVVFGGMGWLGATIDIGSMMSASIALGVAVDDTIHFLARFRHELEQSRDRLRSVERAFMHCAGPTIQAGLVNGVGLSVFALSTFTPTKQFGLLMLAIVLSGIVAELLLLPAMLAGPLGRCFELRDVKRRAASPRSHLEVDGIPAPHAIPLNARRLAKTT